MSTTTLSTEQCYAFEVFPKRDLVIVRGEGATLYDESGRAYIDCIGGVGVASIGHANPDVARAIGEQARTLVTCPGIFYNDARARLLEKLVSITPPSVSRAFFCNSGPRRTRRPSSSRCTRPGAAALCARCAGSTAGR